jgi:hypothetical protein
MRQQQKVDELARQMGDQFQVQQVVQVCPRQQFARRHFHSQQLAHVEQALQ